LKHSLDVGRTFNAVLWKRLPGPVMVPLTCVFNAEPVDDLTLREGWFEIWSTRPCRFLGLISAADPEVVRQRLLPAAEAPGSFFVLWRGELEVPGAAGGNWPVKGRWLVTLTKGFPIVHPVGRLPVGRFGE
jgi:hypothetical protein